MMQYFFKNRDIGLSIIILFVSFFILFIIVYFRPFLGDDVLGFFEGALTFYTKPSCPYLGERYTTISQIFQSAWYQYMSWDGRILPGILGRVITMFHPIVNALVVSFIYTGIVVLSLRLVCGSIKNVLKNPAYLAVFLPLFLFYGKMMDYSIMRTLAILYGLSLLLYLILLNFTQYILKNENLSLRVIIFFNFIGFLCSITHELYGAWFIIIIFIHISIHNGISECLYKLKYYIGLLLGYPLCFFAPGNFNRLHNPHDAGIFRPYNVKLHNSYDLHINCLSPCEYMGEIIYYVLLFFAFLSLFNMLKTENKILKSKSSLLQCLEFFFYIVISIYLWACVSYVPSYGVIGPLAFKYIICFIIIHNGMKLFKRFFTYVAILLFIFSIVDMGSWCQDMVHTSKIWMQKIDLSITTKAKEVHVPAFKTKRRIMFLSYVNNSHHYATNYYLKYYGVKIIVDM